MTEEQLVLWEGMTKADMSDVESEEDETNKIVLVRHRPSWRTQAENNLVDKMIKLEKERPQYGEISSRPTPLHRGEQ